MVGTLFKLSSSRKKIEFQPRLLRLDIIAPDNNFTYMIEMKNYKTTFYLESNIL